MCNPGPPPPRIRVHRWQRVSWRRRREQPEQRRRRRRRRSNLAPCVPTQAACVRVHSERLPRPPATLFFNLSSSTDCPATRRRFLTFHCSIAILGTTPSFLPSFLSSQDVSYEGKPECVSAHTPLISSKSDTLCTKIVVVEPRSLVRSFVRELPTYLLHMRVPPPGRSVVRPYFLCAARRRQSLDRLTSICHSTDAHAQCLVE